MNFFDLQYQVHLEDSIEFGLCDDPGNTPAYVDKENREKWIATVHNKNNISLIFTAIDKGVIKDNEEIDRGRCDCMLTSENHLFFVELKNRTPPWQIKAIEQLESTIQFFKQNHPSITYYHQKAFGCNKKRPYFFSAESEVKKRFFELYKFHLYLQCDIKFS